MQILMAAGIWEKEKQTYSELREADKYYKLLKNYY